MYLGFSSDHLDQNQITDYLTRVVQPKLSSIQGVQRAEILGGRTFAMRIWLKPDRSGAEQLSLGAGADQGIDGLGQPGGQYESPDGR
jgi:multidrug efflux pump